MPTLILLRTSVEHFPTMPFWQAFGIPRNGDLGWETPAALEAQFLNTNGSIGMAEFPPGEGPMLRIVKQAIISMAICHLFVTLSAAQEDEALIARNRYVMTKLQSELDDTYMRSVEIAKLSRTPADLEILKDSESKWRAYRDAECEAEYPHSTADQRECLISMTRQRIARLKAAYLKAAFTLNSN